MGWIPSCIELGFRVLYCQPYNRRSTLPYECSMFVARTCQQASTGRGTQLHSLLLSPPCATMTQPHDSHYGRRV